jgi:hypothetical protein
MHDGKVAPLGLAVGSRPKPQTLAHDAGERRMVRSTEHTNPVFATADYPSSIPPPPHPSQWPFVRLYDKVSVPRDNTLIVQRADVANKTPAQLQAFFALSFLPKFICDASVPVGGIVTLCTLTNAAGQGARIYLARTRLDLADERPLESR